MRRQFIIFICIIAIYCAGCAAPGTYLKNRANDFADCFKADVGVGGGVDMQVKATEYIATGVGAAYTYKIGFRGRYTGKWTDGHIGFPVGTIVAIGIGWPIYITDWAELNNLPKGISATGNFSIIFINMESERHIPIINRFDFEVGGTALFVSAKAGFSLGQFLDFILGITGIDIAQDDKKIGTSETKEKQAPNK